LTVDSGQLIVILLAMPFDYAQGRVWSKPVGETGSPPAPLQKGGAGAPPSKGGEGI